MVRQALDCKRYLPMWIAALALVSAAWGAEPPKSPAELPAPAASAPVRLLLDQAAALLTQQRAAEALAAADQALAKAKAMNDVPGEALSQRERALHLEVLKRPEEARSAWEAAGAAWRQAGDGPGEVEALAREAMLHPEGPERERRLAGALALAGKEKRRALALSAVLLAAGDHADDLGWESAARDLVNAAVAIRERIVPGSADLAGSLFLAGYLAYGRRELAAAKDYDQRALAIQEKLAPGSPDVANSLNNLGIVAYHQGDLAAAKGYHQRALAIQESMDPVSPDVARSLINLGNVAHDQGDLAAAKDCYQRALALQENLAPGSLAVGDSLNNLGIVAEHRGDLAAAQEYYQRALAIREKLAPGSLGVAASLNNLGGVAYSQGNLAAAREYYERSLAMREKLAPGSLDVAGSLNNLGFAAYDQGDLAAAEGYYQRALALQERLAPDPPGVANTLTGLGYVAFGKGNLDAAKGYYQRALTIREKRAPGSLDVANSLVGLGNVACGQGDLAVAKGYFERALALQEKLAPGSLAVAGSLNDLGGVARQQGDLAAAKDYRQRALALQEKRAPDSLDVAASLRNLGVIAEKEGDLIGAEERFREAWGLVRAQAARVGGDEARQAFGTQYGFYAANLAACQLQRKETGDALVTLEEGRAQALQQLLDERGVTASLAPPVLWKTYQERLSAQQQALRSLERVGDAESKDEARLEQAVGDVEKTADRDKLEQDRKETGAQRDAYVAVRVEAEHAWAVVKDAVSVAHPEVLPKPVEPAAAVAALPSGELAVEFSVGDQESTVFLVRHGTPVQAFPLKISLKDLTELVGVVRKQVSGDEGGRAAALAGEEDLRMERLRSTYRLLFPAETRATLHAAHRVVLSPDGPLWELPFAALITNETGDPEYLGLQKPLTYAQSLTVYLRSRQAPAPASDSVDLRQAVIVGNPLYDNARRAALVPGPPPKTEALIASQTTLVETSPRALLTRDGSAPAQLAHAEEEARRVAAIYGTQSHVLAEPTEAWFREHVPSAPLIHLATHGYLRPNQPLSSGVLLAVPEQQSAVSGQQSAVSGQRSVDGSQLSVDSQSDGALQAWKILQLHLKADLVVLSACETGLGSRVPGEGLIGLTRAWQIAGARSVVASEWKVDDASTAALMEAFHRELRQGTAKDDALRRAMQATAKQYPHPYFWAPFLLVGDPENHLFVSSEQ